VSDTLQLAKKLFHAKMTNILWDEMVFHASPYYLPSIACAGGYVCLYALVARFGLVLGCVFGMIVFALITQTMTQWSIMEHRIRTPVGFVLGGYLACVYSYIAHLQTHLSVGMNLQLWVFGGLSSYFAWSMHRYRPAGVMPTNKSALANQIIHSCPKEGTYEEHSEVS
jgi:hypothetical protein